LLFLAALYHDCGKPQTRSEDPDGRIHFLQHERVGAELARKRALELHLSNVEIQRLVTIIQHHLRPKSLAQVGREPSRRSIYRFFRDTGPAGMDVCLLSLADTYATYGHTLSQDTWEVHLQVVRRLLEVYWDASTKWINPTPLLNGHDLIQELGISPGPRIGQILAALLEFQASGEIQSREQALEWARGWIRKHPEN
jgi:poly(A) polymerase